MAESSKHLDLVERILSYIQMNYSGIQHVAILHDLPGLIGCDKPPKIGAFRPDVYAIDAPITRTIVGEAKTQLDLETDHSKEQVASFMNYLRHQENGILILAVPWQAKATARSVVDVIGLRLDIAPGRIQVVVIDDIETLQ